MEVVRTAAMLERIVMNKSEKIEFVGERIVSAYLPRNNCFDRIILAGGLHDEHEEHVGHIDNPDGLHRASFMRQSR